MPKTKYYLPANDIETAYPKEKTAQSFDYDKNFDLFNNAIILSLILKRDPLINKGKPVACGGVCDDKSNFLAGDFYE